MLALMVGVFCAVIAIVLALQPGTQWGANLLLGLVSITALATGIRQLVRLRRDRITPHDPTD